MRTLMAAVASILLASTAMAAPQIEVLALFRGQAMLVIDGKPVTMRDGQTGPQGVELVAADSRSATIRWHGQRRRLTLSRRIASNFSSPASVRVDISRGDDDHYHIDGLIDGQTVQFLVDTGATVVAINSMTARSLGLDWHAARPTRVRTASGYALAWPVMLRRVEVGGIALSNVQAVVTSGAFPREVLLGMSFLGEVSMHESNGVLSLVQ